jgi:hypothetical protein
VSVENRTLAVRRITPEELASPNAKMPWLLCDADDPTQVLYPRGMLGLVPQGHFRYRLAIETIRRHYAKRGYAKRLADYHYLCLACGEVAPVDSFEALKHDLETGGLVPSLPGEMDPLLRCPHCRHLHTDDDGNPGLCAGSFDACESQRREWEGIYREYWEDQIAEVDRLAKALIDGAEVRGR